VGESQENIFLCNHSKITVTGFPWMNKKSGCSRARQRCGYLAANVSGFAHAGDNHAPPATQNESTGLSEAFVNSIAERQNGGRFIFNDPPRREAERLGSGVIRITRGTRLHGVQYSHADIMPFLKAQDWLCLRISYFCSVAFLP
jgi:hypothetical protein